LETDNVLLLFFRSEEVRSTFEVSEEEVEVEEDEEEEEEDLTGVTKIDKGVRVGLLDSGEALEVEAEEEEGDIVLVTVVVVVVEAITVVVS
jgi:hypothetical protein